MQLMNEKWRHGVKGPPFFVLLGGEGRGVRGLFFQVVFGLERGPIMHYSLSTWTLDG